MKYLKSAFNYTGSKYTLLDKLAPHFPDESEVNTFYDLFCGGGSVFINSSYTNIVANDVLTPLMKFYTVLKENQWVDILEELSKHFFDKTDQLAYNKLREEFNSSTNPYQFFCLVHACTNNMMRFNQTWGKRHYNPNTEIKLKGYYDKIQASNIKFNNINYQELLSEIISDNKNFVYLDPPYTITEAGYNTYWGKDADTKLMEFLKILNSYNIKFILSNVSLHKGVINPCMDEYINYNIINIEHDYTKVSRGLNDTQEIIVKNF